MTTIAPADGLTTKLDVNNRVVLPRAARDAAGIEPGATLAVLVDGDGVIRLMTRRAITLELQRMFKPLRDADPRPAEEIVREMRDEDLAAEGDDAQAEA